MKISILKCTWKVSEALKFVNLFIYLWAWIVQAHRYFGLPSGRKDFTMDMVQGGRVKNLKDFRWEPLYDTLLVAAASPLAVFTQMFFSTPVSGTKTKVDTNMATAGVLPNPQVFRCFGLRAEAQCTDPADWSVLASFLKKSWIRFFVGTKDYLTVPLAAISGKMYLNLNGSINDGTAVRAFSCLGSPSVSGYKLPKNGFVDILALENFGVEWNSQVTDNLLTSLKVRVYLDGFRGVDVR